LRRCRLFFSDTKTALLMLYDDYGVLSGSRQYAAELTRLKKIESYHNRIMRLRLAIMTGDEKTMRKLTGSTSIKVAEGTLKLWIQEYERATAKDADNDTTGEGFNSTLVEISKYMGFRIDPKSVTVSEFASMIQSFNRELEQRKKSLKSKH
jgi:hypothetical protein